MMHTNEATGPVSPTRRHGSLYLERFEPKSGTWVSDMPSLAKYVWNGEVGAEAIAAAEAERLMQVLG